MKAKEWFKSLLAGAAIGVGASIPGVSGGTIAVIFKVYKKIIDALSNLLKHFVKSFLILLPVVLGAIIAIIPCFFLFDVAFEGFVFGIVSLFAGLIIGSFQEVVGEVKNEKKSGICWIIFAISLVFAIGLGVASVLLGDKISIESHFVNPKWWFYIILVLVGAIGAVAFVVPGISGSMILLILGFYTPLLDIATGLFKDFLGQYFWQSILECLCFGIGMIIGIITIAKLMNYLIKRFHTQTFMGIIGFIIGSTITLYFNHDIYSYYQIWGGGNYVFMPMWLELILGALLLILGIVISKVLLKIHQKRKAELGDENSAENPSDDEIKKDA